MLSGEIINGGPKVSRLKVFGCGCECVLGGGLNESRGDDDGKEFVRMPVRVTGLKVWAFEQVQHRGLLSGSCLSCCWSEWRIE